MSSSKPRDSSNESRKVSNRISSKVWYFVVYPESTNIQDVITNACLGAFDYAIMLHDSDFDNDGNLKKAHYHCAIWRPRVATLKQIKELFGIQHAERPRYGSTLGDYITYMTHEKEPDKHQYPIEQLKTNVSRETLSKVQSSDLGLRESTTEDTLNDLIALMQGDITYRDFYMAHPRFLYNPRSLDILRRQFGYDTFDFQQECNGKDGSRVTAPYYQKSKFDINKKGTKYDY